MTSGSEWGPGRQVGVRNVSWRAGGRAGGPSELPVKAATEHENQKKCFSSTEPENVQPSGQWLSSWLGAGTSCLLQATARLQLLQPPLQQQQQTRNTRNCFVSKWHSLCAPVRLINLPSARTPPAARTELSQCSLLSVPSLPPVNGSRWRVVVGFI